MAAITNGGFTWTSTGDAEVVLGLNVTATFLPTLRVTPVLGRNFMDEEDRPGGNTRVVIVSDGFWKRALGSDPNVIGRTLSLNRTCWPNQSARLAIPGMTNIQRPAPDGMSKYPASEANNASWS